MFFYKFHCGVITCDYIVYGYFMLVKTQYHAYKTPKQLIFYYVGS